MLAGGVDPICSLAAQSATISVPASAISIGYLLALGEDPDLPWANDINISVSPEQDFLIEVSREEAGPLGDQVTFAFTDPYSFQITDSGWTYGEFAKLEGKFNRPINLTVKSKSTSAPKRRACYIATPSSAPKCGSVTYGIYTANVPVPEGSYAIGYSIELPDEGVGNDWARQEEIKIEGSGPSYSQIVDIIRPNTDYEVGSVGNFTSPYMFDEADQGSTFGEFIPLSGERNTGLTYELYSAGGSNPSRLACYRVESGATTCGNTGSYHRSSTVTVPPEAVSIGYKLSLPETAVGSDTVIVLEPRLSGGGTWFSIDDFQVIRPNADIETGSVESFSASYTLPDGSAGYTYGEFVAINGPRNVSLTLKMKRISGPHSNRAVCYRTEDGSTSCGGYSYSNVEQTHTIPPEAVSIGYRFQLPVPISQAESVYVINMRLYRSGTTLMDGNFEIRQPGLSSE